MKYMKALRIAAEELYMELIKTRYVPETMEEWIEKKVSEWAAKSDMKLSYSMFKVDGDEHWQTGFTDNTTWNGWAKPYFTRVQVEEYLGKNNWKFKFEKENLVLDLEDHEEIYSPETKNTARFGDMTLYNMTGLCWIDKRKKQ